MENRFSGVGTHASLLSLKPGHTTGGSRRGARRAGRGRTALFANRTVRLRNNPSSHSLKHRRHVAEARTSEILLKPMEEQNPRLKRGSFAGYSGLSAGREALFLPGCRPVERRFFVFVSENGGGGLDTRAEPYPARHGMSERQRESPQSRRGVPENRSESGRKYILQRQKTLLMQGTSGNLTDSHTD